jgi:hypothetical protein
MPAPKATSTASAEMERIALMKWLMESKYSLLSGEEISGSSGGFERDIQGRITHPAHPLWQGIHDLLRQGYEIILVVIGISNVPANCQYEDVRELGD